MPTLYLVPVRYTRSYIHFLLLDTFIDQVLLLHFSLEVEMPFRIMPDFLFDVLTPMSSLCTQ